MPPLKTTKIAKLKLFQNLYPRERWEPDEWAERCRVLSNEESSEPGAYRFDRTPYLRDPIRAAANRTIDEIVFLKGAQVGWSELCRNILGYWVDLDPGPILILMADQKAAEDFREERIEPLIKHTQAVRRHVSSRAWDTTKHRIRFDTCSVFFAWAGSKSGTKSRPVRRLVCEEPDEYPPFSSTGGDPLSKAEKRLTTYQDKGLAKTLIGGTPTTRKGNTWKRWELCGVRYHYWVPCPHCNQFQLLQWKQVKWPELKELSRAARANQIRSESLAYYECEHCKEQIRDHHKPRMLRLGRWAAEDQVVTIDGRIVGQSPPNSRRIGYKISGLYSPWVGFSLLASEWIEAQDDPNALCDFINQRLAETFEEQRAKTEPTFIEEKSKGAPEPLIVPSWARLLIATADTQGNNEQDGYFWYVIRAWGYDYHSQLIDYGVCSSKTELVQRCLERQINRESGSPVSPQVLLVDSGGPRWNEVYQLAQSDPRIHPTKGSAHKRTWMVDERPQKKHGVVLWEIDTDQAKDQLHRLIHDPDKTKWLPHSKIGADYCSQMCAESKVFNPTENREEWVEIVKNNNHLFDAEAMQCAAAWRMGCGASEPKNEIKTPSGPGVQSSEWLSRGNNKW